jgi:hypothetical protein
MGVAWYGAVLGIHKSIPAVSGIAPLGTEVYTDIASLRVESVREDPVGVLPFTPPEGFTFVIPTLIITNRTEKDFQLLPSLTLYIKDDEGNVYNVAMAPVEGNQFGGPLLPHDKDRQELGFLVSKKAKGLVLYFEAGSTVLTESLERPAGFFR